MKKIAGSLVFATCALACGSGRIRGGRAVAAGHEPRGRVIESYVAADCRDAAGAPVPDAQSVRLFYVATERRKLLVEAKRGYDSLVVENSFTDGREQVFQVILRNRRARRVLRDYRVPREGGPRGRMAVAAKWKESGLRGGGFRGFFDAPLMTCALVASDEEPPQAAPQDAAAPSPPPPAPPAHYGAPEPQESYAVGDTVVVTRGGAEVRARVVQAVGGRYFVEYGAGGPTEWVDAARIEGKVP